MWPKFNKLPGFLLDIDPNYKEITELDIHCPRCFTWGKRPIMIDKWIDRQMPKPDDCYVQCPRCYHVIDKSDIEKLNLRDKYSVIPFPHDEFTGEPIKLTEEQKENIIKKFNEDRKKVIGFSLSWNNLFH